VAADRDDFGEDRERDLLGGTGADVQTNGGVDAREVVLSEALLAQPRESFLIGCSASDRADVSGLGSECRNKRWVIELWIVREDHDGRTRTEGQLRERDIVDERALSAMERVPRELFVPPEERKRAYEDAALPIGSGQTISQPYMVARICEVLALTGSERVLDVGTGSGYQAAVLAELAAEVVTIERIPELAAEAERALAEAGYENVEVRVGDGTLGVPDLAPFRAIAVAAAAPDIPETLYEQLEPGGRMAIPVGRRRSQDLLLVVRSPEGPAIIRSVPCRFVPLLGEEGFS